MVDETIKISIENNKDVLEALELKRNGFRFFIERINLEGIRKDLLPEKSRLAWSELGTEAWKNCGHINMD